MKRYAEKNYIAYDPVYKTAFISRKPFTWQDINEQQPLKPIQRKVMAEAREAGLKDGVALSIQGSSGEIIGVGMASSDGGVDLSKDAVSKIYMIVNQFHLCYSDLISENVPLSINNDTFLSKREREVLIWSGQNKSTADIADIMGVSAKTIEFHLANIYKKLGVNGRILAVIKALHHGLISL
jgi:DNA-binding CsgD family transcriptional regulator